MINIAELHPKFITDENGIKQSVVLSIAAFQELVENLEDLAVVAERKEEPTISHTEFLKELKTSGHL
ncbi:MAG: hypothetical protein KAQ91_04570 [Methylococcales bacterium]|nr:hypothetical protein [Methylococcales bacterium]